MRDPCAEVAPKLRRSCAEVEGASIPFLRRSESPETRRNPPFAPKSSCARAQHYMLSGIFGAVVPRAEVCAEDVRFASLRTHFSAKHQWGQG